MENIGAGDLQNVVEIAHGLDIFDHGYDEHLRVDPGSSLVAGYADAVVLGASSSHATLAVGVIPRGRGYGSRLVAGVDMGHDDALQSTVQVAQYGLLVVGGDSGDGSDAKGLGSANHVLNLVEVGWAVLAVNHHEVVAESTENLDHVGSVSGDDGPENDFAFVQLGLGGVRTHAISLSGNSNCWYWPGHRQEPQNSRVYKEPSITMSRRVGLPDATALSTAGLIWDGSVMRSPLTPMLFAIEAMSKGVANSE